MSDALEAELDALFQLPPAAMIEARDALVARLRKAGDRPGAARVKALKRPTPCAWALNQLHFRASSALAQALSGAEEVRAQHARDGVTAHALRAAHEAQRAATQSLVDAVLGLCREAGLPEGAVQARKTAATVRGLLAGLGDEAPGRMTHDLEPGGFEAIAALGEPAAHTPAPTPERKPESAKPDARARARLASELAAEEGRLREATAALSRLRGKAESAQREFEQQTRRVTELEAELTTARRSAETRAVSLERAQAEHENALVEQANAEAAVAARRAELAALSRADDL